MASDPQLELRVSRLENDTSSIYDLITDIRTVQHEHSRRFDTMETRFDTMETRFDTMETRFDTMETRFDTIESTLTEVVRRLPEPS
jgi:chaperonin cofactor prefoldin